MSIAYRRGTKEDLDGMRTLAIKAWSAFQHLLSEDNWKLLKQSISNPNTYKDLLRQSICILSVTDNENIVGMAFLVPKGNPTDIYLNEWSHIRFVSVDPQFGGQGIGKKLTSMCIDLARQSGEEVIALHTSEIMDKARHIYESLGFKILKEIDPRFGKRYWLYILKITNV